MGRKLRARADSALDLKDRLIRRGKLLREEAEHRVEEAASILAGKRSAAGTRGDGVSASDVHDPAVSGA
jgi:hypothetical protein